MKFTLQALTASLVVSSASAMWGYWVPPLDEPGVTCEHKRIKIPGHGEYTCMTVGTGICRDNGGYFGEWRFGIDTIAAGDMPVGYEDNCPVDTTYPTVIDPGTKLYPLRGPALLSDDGRRCIQNDDAGDGPGTARTLCTYADTTHICIGENIETDYSKFSHERPYLFFYNEKTHTFLYQLICDGAGTEGKLPQLKMVNNEDLASEQYVEYPVDITKFKKGTTADPEDNNELWKVKVDWNGYVDPVTKTVGQLAPFIDVAHPYFCTEYYGGVNNMGEGRRNINGQGTTLSCWDNDCSQAFDDVDFRLENNIYTNEQLKRMRTNVNTVDGCPGGSSPED